MNADENKAKKLTTDEHGSYDWGNQENFLPLINTDRKIASNAKIGKDRRK